MANNKQIKRRRFNRVSIDDLYYSSQNKNNTLKNKKARSNRRTSSRENPLFINMKKIGANITTMYNQEGRVYSNDCIDGKYHVFLKNGNEFYAHYSSLTVISYF